MEQRHIAFAVEHAYGHILPTLGIAMELMRRGHRVSYAVTQEFAFGVERIGARALVVNPMVARPDILDSIAAGDMRRVEAIRRERTQKSLGQLQALYQDDAPDLIIHDACEDVAGRSLAIELNIPHIRFCPVPLKSDGEGNLGQEFAEDSVILVSVPQFFCESVSAYVREPVKIVGFVPEGRTQFFEPWKTRNDGRQLILVSVTTGILPQVEFCKKVIDAFQSEPWRVVLSIGGLDRVSKIAETDLGNLPENVQLNQMSSNFDILQHASLFVTQGGQGSVLEALYRGVPVLGIPSYFWDEDACRVVAELGLGTRLAFSDISPDRLREQASTLLGDRDTQDRVRRVQSLMHEERGAEIAADVVETYLGIGA